MLSGRPDNVMLINGIGVVYTQRLQEAGIVTYKALAEASDEYLAQVTGATLERIRREEWRVQARLFGNID
jgi:predicted flap endonuclease-1-like 5' DNA nuclease